MRILVVDDDKAILKLITRVLRDEAYAVDTASTGEEARTLALVNEYDGIILDLQLGDRHGFEILQELRRNGRVTCNGEDVSLTSMELRLLEHLMLRTGETVSRSELHDKVWDMHFDPSSNVIDAHVARLRKKLQKSGASASITTRRGIGFVLESVTPSPATT